MAKRPRPEVEQVREAMRDHDERHEKEEERPPVQERDEGDDGEQDEDE